MSIAADTFAVPAPDAVPAAARRVPRRLAVGKFAVAFVATVLVGSAFRAIADAGVNQALDNYYARQAALFAEPVPELVAAIERGDDASATAD